MEQIRNFGFLLKDVYRLWVRHFEQRAAQLGMTLTQCRVLVFLSRNEGTTQAKLAEMSDTEPMTLVRVLDRMQRDGWIERRADPNDRRAYRLHLKPASDPVLAELTRIGEKARSEALAGLSATEREQMMGLLERVRGNLEKLVPSSGDSTSSSLNRGEPPARSNKSPKTDSPRRARRATTRTSRTRRRKATS